MKDFTFRNYAGPEDLDHQYRIWTAATEGLPFAWRSNVTNVSHISAHAAKFPGARLFAQRDGEVVGYIGTHDPFQWKDFGKAVPFGFPWTWPRDEGLERELYERMVEATPRAYTGQRVDFYIQRFRRSWERQHAFLQERGWREGWRDPILTREVGKREHRPPGTAAGGTGGSTEGDAGSTVVALTEDLLGEVAQIAAGDPTGGSPAPDVKALRQRFKDGWAEWSAAWLVRDAGAFALEVRRPWAEVKMFYATPHAWERVLGAMEDAAAALGASEVYFTLRPGFEGRRGPLEERGFRHVDDDVFVRKDLA